MREILFRGKRKDNNGEWIYGGLLDYWVGSGEELYLVTKSVFPPFVEMIPETIGQYTGVKDKSGRKIFEGDVVVDNRGCISVVEYVNGGFHSQDDAYSLGYYAMSLKVIGNVHDDPELLRG